MGRHGAVTGRLHAPNASSRDPLAAVARLLRVVRDDVRSGRLERTMALMTAVSAVVSGIEAYLQHGRGDFDNPWMWTPVWLTPPAAAAGAASIVSERIARTALPVVSAASVLDGAVGFLLHVRGVRREPGGFGLGQNAFVMGPPLFAPLLMSSVGVLGLLASAMRRETLAEGAASGIADIARGAVASGIVERVAEGRFQRGMALTAASFAVLAGGEAYLEHTRGSFNDPIMWTPVWLTGPTVLAALATVVDADAASVALPVASLAMLVDGVVGFGVHLRGIRRMPGGFGNLRFNATLGPPLFAPLLFTAVGTLGLVASLMRRGR